MRRSIYLEEDVYAGLEALAGASEKSVNAVICEALRAYTAAPKRATAVRANRPERKPTPKPRNRQAEELVDLLETLVLQNGRPRHLVNVESWYTPARLLLERDKRDVGEAVALVRWCQADDFWRANILSMDTFRKQYDRLRLQSARGKPKNDAPRGDSVRSWASFAARRLGLQAERAEVLVRAHLDRTGAMPTLEELAA